MHFLYDRYLKVESLAHIGSWEQDIVTQKATWSDGLFRLLGYEPAAFKPTTNTLLAVFTKEDAAFIEASLVMTVTHKQKFRHEASVLTAHHQQLSLVIEADVICDEKGDPCKLVGYMQDVTAQKKAQRLLEQNEHLFRSLFEESAIATAMADRSGRLFKVNKKMCSLLGYTMSEFTKLTIRDITYHLDIDPSILYFDKLMNNEIKSYQLEKRYQRKDGSVFWGLLTISAVLDNHSKAQYMVGRIQDIDESKKATAQILRLNDQLKAASHQKDQLFSIISHDLRNPIWASRQLIKLMIDNYERFNKETLLKHLGILYKSAGNVYELLEELLKWSSMQMLDPEFKPEKLEVSSIVEEVTRTLSESIKKKNISLTINVSRHLLVMADRSMFKTILRNLLGNARKFTRPHGSISILAKELQDFIEISVEDNGTGIKPENINKLFNTASNFTTFGTEGEKGTGLGLDICYQLVIKQGGHISVESKWGEGSSFVFTLPKT